MGWTIKQPNGTTILDSATEFGLYLIDVQSVQFTSNPSGQQRVWNFNYSSQASKVYPLLIPNGYVTGPDGWGPKITNWSGENDTSFTVNANSSGPISGSLASSNSHGWTLYILAAQLTSTQQSATPRFSFEADTGNRSIISDSGAPLRYVGSSKPSQNSAFTPPSLAGGASPFSVNTIGVIKPGSTGVSLGPEPGGSKWWRGGTQSSATTYWFDTKWPRTNLSGTPYMKMKETTSPNRVFFDSRERYLRVLDIDITNIPSSNFSGYVVPSLAGGVTIASFSSSRVPNNNSWGVICNVGGEHPFGSSLANGGFKRSGRKLISTTGGSFGSSGGLSIPGRQVIAIAVDLTGF